MNAFIPFLKKEVTHTLRTYKLLILLVVFLLLALMSPSLAKFTPEIMEIAGIGALEMPAATALDSWGQFYGNVSQMGILALLLVYGGSLSSERSHGTLVLPLTHGLSRTAVVLAKGVVALGAWTLAFVLAAVVNYSYTLYLFPGETVSFLLGGLTCFWLCGVFLLSLVPLSAVLVKGSFGGLALPGIVLFVLLILLAFPGMFTFNPLLLTSKPLEVMAGAAEASKLLPALITASLVSVGSVVAALLLFKRSAL